MSIHTRLYDDYSVAATVSERLRAADIPGDDIGILTPRAGGEETTHPASMPDATTPAAGIGTALGGGAGLLAGVGLMAIPGLGPVVALGWVASTLTGAVAGAVTGGVAGSIIDSLSGTGVPAADAHVYSEALRRGGTLVSVRCPAEKDALVVSLLDEALPVDLSERSAVYRSEGWSASHPIAREIEEADRQRSA